VCLPRWTDRTRTFVFASSTFTLWLEDTTPSCETWALCGWHTPVHVFRTITAIKGALARPRGRRTHALPSRHELSVPVPRLTLLAATRWPTRPHRSVRERATAC
jgi:hypothetical protein